MKILLLQDHLRSGGTERQTVLLARAFHAVGHGVRVLTFRPGGALAATLGDVAHESLQPFDTRLDWFAPRLRARVATFAPDVIFLMGRMANGRGAALARAFPRAAVVGTMRTGKNLQRAYVRSLHAARHVVANSAEAARLLTARHGVAAEKISVIHNALVFPAALPRAEAARHRAELRALQGTSASATVLLCVGMFRPEKNQRELLSIATRLPRDADWQLWLAGEGVTRAECTTLAMQLGLGDRVRFFGFTADPTPLYAAADLAVLTSQAESLSNFLIEAQAHGLPAVAYDVGGVAECFVPGGTGFAIAPGDQSAFAAALAPLLADDADRARRGDAARDFARRSFSPEPQAQAYLDLFARLLNSSAP